MEEASIEAGVHELTHRAGIAVRQDRLRAVGRSRDVLEARRDFANGLGPRDALEATFALLPDSALRVEHAVRMVDALEVVVDLLAEEAAGEGVVAVAAKLDGAARGFIDGDNHAARVRAIVGADGFHGLQFASHGGRTRKIIEGTPESSRPDDNGVTGIQPVRSEFPSKFEPFACGLPPHRTEYSR